MLKKKILVVEDSPIVSKVIKHLLSQSDSVAPIYASSFKSAQNLLSQHRDFFAAMVDLNLPDAPDGEIVDLVIQDKIPTIVLTGSFDEQRREKLLEKGVVDYVTKEGRYSYLYAVNVVERLIKNQDIKVLVVDDSSTARKFVANLLRLHLYKVLEARDGVEAIKAVIENPDIKLLITDFNMPRMDGAELVKNLRVKYEKTDLIIIGLSSEGEGALSAKFIKNGASDFLRKPFNHEEFYCRISHNVELLERIEEIRDFAYRDDLTGVHNRKYFFEKGAEAHRRAIENNSPLAAAIIDFDNFKSINDRLGNDAGDQVIVYFSRFLSNAFSRFIFSRTGGQEFFVLMPGLGNEKAVEFVDSVRGLIGSELLTIGDEKVGLTFSSGVSNYVAGSLDKMLSSASACLFRAKEAGGDLVMGDDE